MTNKTHKISEMVENVENKADEKMEVMREKVEEARNYAEQAIRKNPFTSIAIAAAVGASIAIGVTTLMHHQRKPMLQRFRDYFD